MKRALLALALMVCSLPGHSIVTRHDVPKEKYLAVDTPDYLIDMPGEGHGVLFKPDWIVTVAHLIFSDYQGREITIKGQRYTIEKVIIHPNAKKPDSKLFKGDAEPLMAFLKSTSDLALIKLTSPVTQVKPLALYQSTNEQGVAITAYGRGSTGNGEQGSVFETKKAKTLRKMQNKIDFVDGNWVSISLDQGNEAFPLEGIDGSGDSGGPLVANVGGRPYLLGMFSWDYVEGDLANFKHGLYGARSYQIRISSYINWIEQQTKTD